MKEYVYFELFKKVKNLEVNIEGVIKKEEIPISISIAVDIVTPPI